jgi:hypothetical protein
MGDARYCHAGGQEAAALAVRFELATANTRLRAPSVWPERGSTG